MALKWNFVNKTAQNLLDFYWQVDLFKTHLISNRYSYINTELPNLKNSNLNNSPRIEEV
jgi:hypothetical protein